MKDILMKKQEELVKSLQNLEQQMIRLQEQIVMHKGAMQYNAMLLKELEPQTPDQQKEAD